MTTPQAKLLEPQQIAVNGVVQILLWDPPAANQLSHRNFHHKEKQQEKPSFFYHQFKTLYMDFKGMIIE